MTSLHGARVLITGGTGSFGTRVAARLAGREAAEIVIFSRDEQKQWAMRRRYPDFEYVLGDVRDAARVREVMRGVDVVFHAAALKQVPSCEQYPYEAFLTNTVGSQHVCDAAIRAGVELVVALSTDKAVKPLNAMGMSKAMMEKIVCSKDAPGIETNFCCVRYGNVMGSRGSVLALFREQIAAGGPITITVGEMTRFLLTLDDAVDLVEHAMHETIGGEIFVRKAPAATVDDLATAMIARQSPKKPIAREYTGIRPSEKLHETLINEYEMQRLVDYETHFMICPEHWDHGGERSRPLSSFPLGTEYTSANATRLTNIEEIGALLDRMGEIEGES